MTARQVSAWLWRVTEGNKARAAALAGVGRPWLDKALEEGADLKHANALRGAELRTAQGRALEAIREVAASRSGYAKVILNASDARDVQAIVNVEELRSELGRLTNPTLPWHIDWQPYEEIAEVGADLGEPRRAGLEWSEPRSYNSLWDTGDADGAMHYYPEEAKALVRNQGRMIRVGRGLVLVVWLDDSCQDDDWI